MCFCDPRPRPARSLLKTCHELRAELKQTAVEHTKFLADHARRGADILHAVRTAGFASDPDRLQVDCDLFAEHIDYVEDVCRLISHVALKAGGDLLRLLSQKSNLKTHIESKHVDIFFWE